MAHKLRQVDEDLEARYGGASTKKGPAKVASASASAAASSAAPRVAASSISVRGGRGGSRSAAAAPPRRPQPGDLPPSDSEGEEEEEQKQYGKKPARQQGPRDLPPSDSEEEEEHGFEGSDNEGEEREERDEDEDAGAGEDAEPIAVPLLKYLFIGNSMAAHDKNVLLKLGITHVVNCAADEVDNKFENELFVPVKKAAAEEKKEEGEEEGEEEEEVAEEKAAPASAASPAAPAEPQLKALVYTSFPIHDAIDFPIEDFFDDIYTSIHEAKEAGGNVLLHMNSVNDEGHLTLALAYMLRASKEKDKMLPLKEAMHHLQSKYPAPVTMNEGFLGQLVKFEKRLFGVVSVHLSSSHGGSHGHSSRGGPSQRVKGRKKAKRFNRD